MTEQSDINDAFPADASEPPKQVFEAWVDSARPKTQLWRTIAGLVLAIVVSTVFQLAIAIAYVLAAVGTTGGTDGVRQAIDEVGRGTTIAGAMATLFCFLGMWLGVWVALRALHGKQKFFSLISPERRIRWREFGIGVGIMVICLALSSAVGMLTGASTGYRNTISIETWLLILAPMAVLVYIQACGEEIIFRGYLMQHLAARFRHPFVWGFLPAAIFGGIHYLNGTFTEYSIFYVLDAMLFGLIAAATVWRTGSISMAMGIHTVNNLAGFMLSGSDDFMTATPLYLDTVDNAMKAAPYGIAMMVALLVFVLSPWAPMPKRQLFGRRKDTRAAP